MNTVWPGRSCPTALSISSRVSTSAQVSGSGAALPDGVALALAPGLPDGVALADALVVVPWVSFLLFCPHPAAASSTATASPASDTPRTMPATVAATGPTATTARPRG